MTGAADVRPDGGKEPVQVLTAREDVFQELLETLRSESDLELDAKAVKAFRKVVDRTVGDFLVAASREGSEDLWEDEEFKRWTKMNTKKVARAARRRGGKSPSADELITAANAVIRKAHDAYCKQLPKVPRRRAGGRGPKGPVCADYVQSIGAPTG